MRNLLDNNAQAALHYAPGRKEAIVSAENVALVRSVYDNFASGDIPAVLAALHPQIEWVESDNALLPHHGTHHSPQAVAEKVFGMVMANFEQFAVTPELLHDGGDVITVQGRATGRTKTGGVLDAPAAWVWTVRDGKCIRNVNYHDTAAWQSALT
jgi:ketosteroid isomerase-like protein